MIQKETVVTGEKILYRTYSDTGHKIRKINNGVVYDEAIDVNENFQYEEIEDYVELDGVSTYSEVLDLVNLYEKTSRKINRISLSEDESLTVKNVYPKWEHYVGKTIETGYIVQYEDNLWRVRQAHTALSEYPPSVATAALYEIIVKSHSGDISDPIPYNPPMEIFKDKYYIQNDIIYLCIRDSEIPLSHNLSAVIDIYVK